MQDALLVVDMQVDFCEGGALAAHDTESMISAVNALVADYTAQARLVVFTRDWHPADHCSFRDQGGQWPPHCVKDTVGARLHPGLAVPPCHLLVSKASGQDKEAYSGFEGTGLEALLKRMGVRTLAVCGIATEYCVRASVEDAVRLGFGVEVHSRAIRPVAPGSPGEKEALDKFRELGVRLV